MPTTPFDTLVYAACAFWLCVKEAIPAAGRKLAAATAAQPRTAHSPAKKQRGRERGYEQRAVDKIADKAADTGFALQKRHGQRVLQLAAGAS